MTSWPIGLSTGCFYHRNILDCLPLIRESGFSMIEVCSTPEHLNFHDLKSVHRAAERIKELGMEAYSFHAPFAPHIDIASSDDGQRSASVAEIFKAAEAAALLRVHYFVLHPGPENPATIAASEQLPRMQHVVESLNQVACAAKNSASCACWKTNCRICFSGTQATFCGSWMASIPLKSESCLDTGHAFCGGDIHNLVHKLSGHLRIIHAHDNGGGDDNHWPPGDGKIDWEKFMRDLIEVRFRGAFILEMAGNDDPALTMTNARRGRSYLRDMGRRLALAK